MSALATNTPSTAEEPRGSTPRWYKKMFFFLLLFWQVKKKTYYGYVGQLFAVHVSSTMALGSMILEHYFQDVRN